MAKRKSDETVSIAIPADLATKAQEVLSLSGTDVETFVRLQLGAFCRARSILHLDDKMNFGKYIGEKVEDVVRADTNYAKWLLGLDGFAKFGPDVMLLVETLTHES